MSGHKKVGTKKWHGKGLAIPRIGGDLNYKIPFSIPKGFCKIKKKIQDPVGFKCKKTHIFCKKPLTEITENSIQYLQQVTRV